MRIDPDMQATLDRMAAWNRDHAVPPRERQSYEDVRRYGLAAAAIRRPEPLPAVRAVEDVMLPAGAGPLAVRVFRHGPGTGPFVVYVHGGGYVAGSVEQTDHEARRFARSLDADVVSITYRLAPEYPWPAAVDDVEAQVGALAGGGLPGFAGRPMLLIGSSAGAGAIVAATRRLVLAGASPVAALGLINPWLDCTLTLPSCRLFGTGYGLEAATLAGYVAVYAPAGVDADHPELSPARHPVPPGWPPTAMLAAGLDPLVDDTVLYGRRLDEAGVRQAARIVPGMLHGFHGWYAHVRALAEPLAWFDRTLADFAGIQHAGRPDAGTTPPMTA
jgi:acetyl esterase